jgi:small nuclear ribonucleoprotein (snRNP)-like protein
MKNTILNIIFLFIFTSICFCQTKTTKFVLEKDDKLNINLNCKVKVIKIKTDDLRNKSSDSLVYFFMDNGNIDKLIVYGLGIDVLERKLRTEEVHYEFKEGKLISKLNKLGKGIDGDMYTYDKNWNLIVLKNYMFDVLVKETINSYDKENRKIEKKEYLYGGFSEYNDITQANKSSYLNEVEKYEYDSNGFIILKRRYNFRENKTMEMTCYKYDGANNLIEEGNCTSYGDSDCICKPLYGFEYNFLKQQTRSFELAQFSPHNTDSYYTYDNSGNEIETKGLYIYKDKEPILGYHYKTEFDKLGNKIKEEELVGSYRTIGFEKYKTQLSTYDKFQNLILDEYIASDGSRIKVVRKKYKYDKKNNWIKMETEEGKTIDDLKVIEVSERAIKYY